MRSQLWWVAVWGAGLWLVACGSSCGSAPPRRDHAAGGGAVARAHPAAQGRCGPAGDEPPDPSSTLAPPDVPGSPGTATAPATPPGPPPAAVAPTGAGYDPRPFVPRIDAATKARLRAALVAGARAGLRPDVFSKIGDSISESWSFGRDLGMGWVEWGRWEALAPTLERFRQVTLARDGEDALNSFSVQSIGATAGWDAGDVLRPSAALRGRTPLAAEVERTRGAFAIVMFGTNDLERRTDEQFATSLRAVVDELARRHVIAVLSTIPPRLDDAARGALVPAFNARVAAVARAAGLLMIDYHAALQTLPNRGMSVDGVHPSTYREDSAAHFTDQGLRHGYNVRNLLWLLTLEKLHRIVIADGAPD